MLTIRYCEPFNGKLALNGIIGGWLLQNQSGERIRRLVEAKGAEINEMQLFDFIKQTEPHWESLLLMACCLDEAAKAVVPTTAPIPPHPQGASLATRGGVS